MVNSSNKSSLRSTRNCGCSTWTSDQLLVACLKASQTYMRKSVNAKFNLFLLVTNELVALNQISIK